eukprot:COSAG01_NODE_915_length_12761_cov_33.161507_7_plen_82_part_00
MPRTADAILGHIGGGERCVCHHCTVSARSTHRMRHPGEGGGGGGGGAPSPRGGGGRRRGGGGGGGGAARASIEIDYHDFDD